MKTYRELMESGTFMERYLYLRIGGKVGEDTFGFDRWLNQQLYHSKDWQAIRRAVILRDNGCDLAHPDYPLMGRALVHHMNPITRDDILRRRDSVLNPEYLITVSFDTHNAIHYGNESLLPAEPIERRPNDTCPWK